jgi:putative transposase
MGRLPRATDDGLVYHAMNRGNNRADVFAGDGDHEAFLESLRVAQGRYPFALFGYCLMSNHFHLLIKPDSGESISRILQSLSVAHTWRYHKRHRTSGHVWQGASRGSDLVIIYFRSLGLRGVKSFFVFVGPDPLEVN